MSKLSERSFNPLRKMCHICSEVNETDVTKEAKWYCADCSKDMCNQCYRSHKKIPATMFHALTEKAEEHTFQKPTVVVSPNKHSTQMCSHHPHVVLDSYCSDCRVVLCKTCVAVEHYNHKRTNADGMVKELRNQAQHQMDRVRNKYRLSQEDLLSAENQERELMKSIDEIHKAVVRRSKDLVQLVQNSERSLTEHLQNLRTRRVDELKVCREDIKTQRQAMEEFITHSQEQLENAHDSNISSIVDRVVQEATKYHNMIHAEAIMPICIQYIPLDATTVIMNSGRNILGNISESHPTEFHNEAAGRYQFGTSPQVRDVAEAEMENYEEPISTGDNQMNSKGGEIDPDWNENDIYANSQQLGPVVTSNSYDGQTLSSQSGASNTARLSSSSLLATPDNSEGKEPTKPKPGIMHELEDKFAKLRHRSSPKSDAQTQDNLKSDKQQRSESDKRNKGDSEEAPAGFNHLFKRLSKTKPPPIAPPPIAPPPIAPPPIPPPPVPSPKPIGRPPAVPAKPYKHESH